MPTTKPLLTLQDAPVPGQPERHPLVPAALADTRLRTLRDGATAVWENRDRPRRAWHLLRDTVCDHCGLGPRGLRDDTLPGRHLCLKRLQALRGDTIGAFVPADVRDLRLLRQRSAAGLRTLGRVPYPFVARRGDRGFSRLGWDEALALAGDTLGPLDPTAIGVLAGTQGLTNESHYALARATRLLGVANLDLCVPPAVAATHQALAHTLGREASTCSLADLVGADLVLLCGTRMAQDQPALSRVLRAARAAGTRVVGLNLHDDAVHADDVFDVRSPAALLAAVLWLLHDADGLDTEFLGAHVAAWKPALKTVRSVPLATWLDLAGARQAHAEWLATLIGRASSCVSLLGPDWDATYAVLAVHLARGTVGRRNAGVVALGGGGGFQGARDCGVSPVRFAGGGPINKTQARAWKRHWGHDIAEQPGLDASAQLRAAADGTLRALVLAGADPLTTLGATVTPGLARVGLRVHLGSHLDPSMLVDPAETVLLLPVAAPAEQLGGGTLTSVERRVRFTPAVPGRDAPGLSRPAWQVAGQLAAAARPDLASVLTGPDLVALRQEMMALLPDYRGLRVLDQPGDWFQWGGPQLYRDGAFTASRGKARMPEPPLP